MKKSTSKPDLRFMRGGKSSGFPSSSISGFLNTDPVTIVREFVQNSLDAARNAEQKVTRIRFELAKSKVEDIPGIRSYRETFKQVVKDQKKEGLSDLAQKVINTIERCLHQQEECMTLYVMDNGIGLDEKRMKALLGHGLSVKDINSTGSVGNGHLTALPASDLYYVFYGGRYAEGQTICAGHTVLAAHSDEKNRRISEDGYFVSDLHDDYDRPYSFIEGNRIPEDIRSRLDWIHDNWEPGTGTVVMIPAFNKFHEDKKSLWDMVSQAAARSFFAAFEDKELEVEIVEEGVKRTVSRANIQEILDKTKDRKYKDRTNKFLSGSSAWSAFTAIRDGDNHTVAPEYGDLSFRLLHGDRARHIKTSRVDLCRNGMWISDYPPKLQRPDLSEMQPFHCVILLQAKHGEIHRLVRKAEGPLHNELDVKAHLDPEEIKKLETAMGKVHQRLKDLIPVLENEHFRLRGVLDAGIQGASKGGQRRSAARTTAFSRISKPSISRKSLGSEETPAGEGSGAGLRTDTKGAGGEGQGGGGSDKSQKRGPAVTFTAAAALVGRRSCIVQVTPKQTCENVEVYFSVDENDDDTWEMRSAEQLVNLERVKVNGEDLAENNVICEGGGGGRNFQKIPLDELKEGQSVTLEFDFTLPKDAELPDDTPVGLRPQIFKKVRTVLKQEGEE